MWPEEEAEPVDSKGRTWEDQPAGGEPYVHLPSEARVQVCRCLSAEPSQLDSVLTAAWRLGGDAGHLCLAPPSCADWEAAPGGWHCWFIIVARLWAAFVALHCFLCLGIKHPFGLRVLKSQTPAVLCTL